MYRDRICRNDKIRCLTMGSGGQLFFPKADAPGWGLVTEPTVHKVNKSLRRSRVLHRAVVSPTAAPPLPESDQELLSPPARTSGTALKQTRPAAAALGPFSPAPADWLPRPEGDIPAIQGRNWRNYRKRSAGASWSRCNPRANRLRPTTRQMKKYAYSSFPLERDARRCSWLRV